VVEGDVTLARVDGLTVIVKKVPGADLVALQLYVRGGVRNWTKEDAGVEALALQAAANGGTDKLDKDAFARRLAKLGSSLYSWSGNDHGSVQAKSLRANWSETLGLLADAFLRPALPATEIEVQRQLMLSGLKHEESDPDALLRRATHEAVFAGHPYERRSSGTLATVGALTRDKLVAHLAKLRESTRLLVVIVGDVEAKDAIDRARAAFAGVPRGDYQETPPPRLAFPEARLVTSERKLPTNYISGVFAAPGWTDPDHAIGMVAMEVLQNRLFEEVRIKRNLTYAVGAGLGGGGVPRGSLYVTAVDPNTTIKVMFDQVRRLAREPVPPKELEGHRAVFLTGYLVGNETTDGQAGMLATAHLLGGDFRLARGLPDRIRLVAAADVQAFAQKYIGKLTMILLGDPRKADPALFRSL
jgi:zinc protease